MSFRESIDALIRMIRSDIEPDEEILGECIQHLEKVTEATGRGEGERDSRKEGITSIKNATYPSAGADEKKKAAYLLQNWTNW